jgi:hypothetical protein
MLNLISFLTVTSIALLALQLSEEVAGNVGKEESSGVNSRSKWPVGQIAQLKSKVSASKKVNIGGRTRTFGTPVTTITTSSYTATSASSAGTPSSASSSSTTSLTTISVFTTVLVPLTALYTSSTPGGSTVLTVTTSYTPGTSFVSSTVSTVTILSGQYQQCYKDCTTGIITATGPTGAIITASSSSCYAIVTVNCPVTLSTVSPTSTT